MLTRIETLPDSVVGISVSIRRVRYEEPSCVDVHKRCRRAATPPPRVVAVTAQPFDVRFVTGAGTEREHVPNLLRTVAGRHCCGRWSP